MIVLLEAGVLLVANLCKRIFSNKRATEISNSTLPLARTIYVKPIRISTVKSGRNVKPMVNHWACARAHAYHGAFFFSRSLFMRRKVRNADWHLWALHALNRYENHDSGFFYHTLLLSRSETCITFILKEQKPFKTKELKCCITLRFVTPYLLAVLGVYNLQDKPFK